MFHKIPQPVLEQMKALEEIDARDRQDGTPHLKRLRQIPPETGKFLAILAANAPKGAWLEIGTSAGYSALWIVQAANLRGTKLITYELLPDKATLAKKTFQKAKVGDLVEFVHGDARGHVGDYSEVAFCFLDAEREMYLEFYELVVPNLVSGGILAADNAISHGEELAGFIARAEEDPTVDSVIVPIGKGLLVCRKL
jgi:caffeoyl-CoA O-methyltransferase